MRLLKKQIKDKIFYYYEKEAICDKCFESIDDFGILYAYYNKQNKRSGFFWYHIDCFKEVKKPEGIINATYQVVLSGMIPEDVIPIMITPPELKPFDQTTDVWGASEMQSDTIKDNTVLSKSLDESWSGVTIGKNIKEVCQENDKAIEFKDAFKLLQDNQKAVSEIEVLRLEREKEKNKQIR